MYNKHKNKNKKKKRFIINIANISFKYIKILLLRFNIKI